MLSRQPAKLCPALILCQKEIYWPPRRFGLG